MTTYTFSNVDDPNGESIASGINDLGQIVGYYSDSSGATHGFLYSSGSYTTLNEPFGINGTFAYGINDAGQVVGQYIDGTNNSQSFIFYPSLSGSLYTGYLGFSVFNSPTQLFGISDVGFVGDYKDSNNTSHAVLVNGDYILLSDPFGFNHTFAYGVNNADQSVGYYVDSNNADHGFLYSAGNYTTIDDPLGTNGTFAYGINDLGQIVGTYIDSNNIPHGFLYSGGNYTTIDDPLGTNGTFAYGINDAGQIVGEYIDANAVTHGFVATPPTSPTSVQQEILGLYAALYNRAADFFGYSYWVGIDGQQPDAGGVTVANAGTTAVTLNDAQVLGQAFVNTQATFFNATYGSLTDSQFINALYVNIGGNAGDPGGVAYWQNLLQQAEAGGASVQAARAGLVGQFVHDLIDYDLTPGAAALGLTAAQYQEAQTRQATINDIIAVSLGYLNASQLQSGSILNAQSVGDAAYNASVAVIHGVTSDPTTANVAITGIINAVEYQNLTLI
jgi:probable HAF family extracellular repeat protein